MNEHVRDEEIEARVLAMQRAKRKLHEHGSRRPTQQEIIDQFRRELESMGKADKVLDET